jgi:hypothetical protein
MRLQTALALTAAGAALTFQFWPPSSESSLPVMIDDMQPIVGHAAVIADADDDLILVLRQQARTAMLDLQQRQTQY